MIIYKVRLNLNPDLVKDGELYNSYMFKKLNYTVGYIVSAPENVMDVNCRFIIESEKEFYLNQSESINHWFVRREDFIILESYIENNQDKQDNQDNQKELDTFKLKEEVIRLKLLTYDMLRTVADADAVRLYNLGFKSKEEGLEYLVNFAREKISEAEKEFLKRYPD